MQSRALSHLSPKAAVKNSPIHGRGLFAVAGFQPGEIVCIKGGYIFTRTTLEEIQPTLGPAEIQIADDLFIALTGSNWIMKQNGDFAEVSYFVDVPGGTFLHRLVAQRKALYAVCDAFTGEAT
jgi:hypothetical protein